LAGGAGEDVGDELMAVEAPPAVFGGLEQLERHPQRCGFAAGALGDARAQLDRREAALDRARGVDPDWWTPNRLGRKAWAGRMSTEDSSAVSTRVPPSGARAAAVRLAAEGGRRRPRRLGTDGQELA